MLDKDLKTNQIHTMLMFYLWPILSSKEHWQAVGYGRNRACVSETCCSLIYQLHHNTWKQESKEPLLNLRRKVSSALSVGRGSGVNLCVCNQNNLYWLIPAQNQALEVATV